MQKTAILIVFFFSTLSSGVIEAYPAAISHHFTTKAHGQPILVQLHNSKGDPNEFEHLAAAFNQKGYQAITFNFRALTQSLHQSNGVRRQGAGFEYPEPEAFLPAITEQLAQLQSSFPGVPVVVMSSGDMVEVSLKLAARNASLVDGLILFSPNMEGRAQEAEKIAHALKIPVFVTGASEESAAVQELYRWLSTPYKSAYIPEDISGQGGFALSIDTPERSFAWRALDDFLGQYFPTHG
jgi:alpha-beta hydrolase superfamily lysophospholipase